MSLNLGTTQIIIRKEDENGNLKNIICSEVISDQSGKRKFSGKIPSDFPSGNLQSSSNSEVDVVIKIGDVELSKKELGDSLNTPELPDIVVDNEPPEIKVDFLNIDGQNIKLGFGYMADNNIVVDSEADKVNGKGKFQLEDNLNRGKSGMHLPDTPGNPRKPGKNISFAVIAFPFHNGNLYYIPPNYDWNNATVIDTSQFSDSAFVKQFVKNQLEKKADKIKDGQHNPEYLPISEFEFAKDSSETFKLRHKNALTFIQDSDGSTRLSIELSATADLITGYTGLYKVYAVASDHINNHSALTVVTTGELDNTIRVLDVEPPIALLTNVSSTTTGTPEITIAGYYYDLVTPVNAYVIILDEDKDIYTYSDSYGFASATSNQDANGQALKSFMETDGVVLDTDALITDSNAGNFTSNLTQYFDGSNVVPIVAGKDYYVYMMVSETADGVGDSEAFYQNNVFSKSQKVSFSQAIDDSSVSVSSPDSTSVTDDEIVSHGGVVTFNWDMKYEHDDIGAFALEVTNNGTTVATIYTVTKSNRPTKDYTVSYTLNDTDFVNGSVEFSLEFVGTQQTITSFGKTFHYQKTVSVNDATEADGNSWYLSALADGPSSHNTLQINEVRKAIENNLTIASNPAIYLGQPFDLKIFIDNSLSETVSNITRVSDTNYTGLSNSITLSSLDESTDYDVKLGLEMNINTSPTMTSESSPIAINTGEDLPVISGVGANNIPANPSSGSEMMIYPPRYTVSDESSSVNTFAFCISTADSASLSNVELYEFAKHLYTLAGIRDKSDTIFVSDYLPKKPNTHTFTPSAFKHYFTVSNIASRSTSVDSTLLTKTIASYTVVLIAEDNSSNSNYVVNREASVTFSNLKELTIETVTTNNTSDNRFAVEDDTITATFNTRFNATASDFVITVLGQGVIPTSSDNKNWELTFDVPSNYNSNTFFNHSIISFAYVSELKTTLFDISFVVILFSKV